MREPARRFGAIDVEAIEVLLCDVDGNLVPSEEPAFAASTDVINRLLADLGIDRRFTADELQRVAVGKSFRVLACELAGAHGAALSDDELERRVLEERRVVTDRLARVLGPDDRVQEPLRRLRRRFRLAAVSSSASSRLDACFAAAGLAELFPPHMRFSAEDSLPVPASKPDAAIYRFAGERLGVDGARALAIEDSVAGVRSAHGAGFPTVGSLVFVPDGQREARSDALRQAGVAAIISTWEQLEELLAAPGPAPGAPSPGRR